MISICISTSYVDLLTCDITEK